VKAFTTNTRWEIDEKNTHFSMAGAQLSLIVVGSLAQTLLKKIRLT
jgi:hypothetical protein